MNVIKKFIMGSAWFKAYVSVAVAEARKEGEGRFNRIREIENNIRAENFFHEGGQVIVVSNEWSSDNLVRGHIIGFMNHDIPHVRDMDTQKEYVCFGIVVPYHDELYAALQKLNPFERYSLMIARTANSAGCYIFDKQKLQEDV